MEETKIIMRCLACNVDTPLDAVTPNTPCVFCGAGRIMPTAAEVLSQTNLGVVGEVRLPQIELATAVTEALHGDKIGIFEAGTGVGKSFAYMLPAILNRKRLFISTAKKSLQAQLVAKDLPYLRSQLGNYTSFTYKAVYGRSSYACKKEILKKVRATSNAYKLKEWIAFLDNEDSWHWAALYNSPNKKTLPVYPSTALSADNCVSTGCTHYRDCKFISERSTIADADVVVGNHWILGSYAYQNNLDHWMGQFGVIVVDEAHKVDEGLRSAEKIHTKRDFLTTLNELVSETTHEHGYDNLPNYDALEAAWENLFSVAAGRFSNHDILSLRDVMHAEAEVLCQQVTQTLQMLSITRSKGHRDYPTLKTAHTFLLQLHGALVNDRNNYVSYMHRDNKTTDVHLTASPIDMSDRHVILSDMTDSIIYTSATLSAGDLEHFKRSVKAPPERTIERVYGSAFDPDKQSILYLSKALPETFMPGVTHDAMAKECADLINASKGNAFILFTSWADLKEVEARLLHLTPHPIVSQQQHNAADALAIYRNTDNSVLLGLKSFWEGVDVQGSKLRLVIIPKLPFPLKGDPINEARREKSGGQWFIHVDLPDMIIDLRQGVGRLIRSKNDKGVVALLDPRIITKRYRKRTLRSLGISKPTTNKPAVLTALSNLAKADV